MTAIVTLCPDGTVPLGVCDECRALVRARDLDAHEAWHTQLGRLLERLAGVVGDLAALPATAAGAPPQEDPGRC